MGGGRHGQGEQRCLPPPMAPAADDREAAAQSTGAERAHMGWARETQRVGYALLGASARAVEPLADTAGYVGRAWRHRDQWGQRARDVYAELAEHGQSLLHRAERQADRKSVV